jgi:5-methylcytosine-specific restriction endonuclease McrA
MNRYIQDLAFVISNCSMDNTYKMAWIRALVDHSVLNPNIKGIEFNDLSPLIFNYYWNQTIFFKLEQGPNPYKRPKIHQIAIDAVVKYQRNYGYKPDFFTRVAGKIEVDFPQISNILKQDVCWRFSKVGGKEFKFYKLDRNKLRLTLHQPVLLKAHADILYDLINYRWTQKLEELNSSPRISKKVRGISNEKIRRKNLSKFKEYLDLENPDRSSFISGKPIKEEDLSIDHVIPWSYLYTDDLWNLVYVEKHHNSSKSNRLPDEDMIRRLEIRNRKLHSLLIQSGKKNNQVEELSLAIEKDFVRKFWIGCKG